MNKTQNAKTCNHDEVVPAAVFLDSDMEEAWMLQVCETCGASFLLLGIYRPEICE